MIDVLKEHFTYVHTTYLHVRIVHKVVKYVWRLTETLHSTLGKSPKQPPASISETSTSEYVERRVLKRNVNIHWKVAEENDEARLITLM